MEAEPRPHGQREWLVYQVSLCERRINGRAIEAITHCLDGTGQQELSEFEWYKSSIKYHLPAGGALSTNP